MAKIRRKNLLVTLMLIALFSTALLMFTANSTKSELLVTGVSVDSLLFENGNIADKYMIGDVLTIPKGKLSYNGNEYSAQNIFYYPNGDATSADIVTLNKVGICKVEYRAFVDDKLINSTKEFQVANKLYDVNGNKSTVKYGAHSYAPSKEGIVLSLAVGETFNYNKAINLDKMTSLDTLIKLFVTPEKIGEQDANKIVVTLTDAYDSANFVTITGKIYDSGWVSSTGIYMTANAHGQPPTGLEVYKGSGTTIKVVENYEGKRYRVHQNNEYGAWAVFSYLGTPQTGAIGQEFFEVSMDYAKKRVYGTSQVLVTDLDETLFFTELWQGFTTGEVFLSVRADGYQKAAMNMVITNIIGADIKNNNYIDTKAPNIDINYMDYSNDNIPHAVKGKRYPIFDADAYDLQDGSVPIIKKVYYNYYSSSKVQILIEDDSFLANKNGIYTIEYSSVDKEGNRQVVVLDVLSKSNQEELTILLGAKQTTDLVGKIIPIATAKVNSSYSKTNLMVIAKNKNRSEIKYVIDTSKNTFQPLYTGVYSIEYIYSDFIESKTESYEITVSESSQTVFISEALLPKYFIKNCVYTLPQLKAISFVNGAPNEITSTVSIIEDGASAGIVTADKYKVIANSTVTVVYNAVGGGTKTYSNIAVIDTGYGTTNLDLSKYFVGNQYKASATKNHIDYSTDLSKAVDSKARLDFINYQLADCFNFSFNVTNTKSAFSKINLYLKDAKTTKQLKLTYEKASGSTLFSVNGGNKYLLDKDFTAISQDIFSVEYNNRRLTVTPYMGLTIDISKLFKGFDSEYIFFSLELEGINGNSEIAIINLNGQTFSSQKFDGVAPIMTQYKMGGFVAKDTQIIVKAAYALDVLDPNITFKLFVEGVDKNFVTDVNGIKLDGLESTDKDYTFIATQYGRYNVYYELKDSGGEPLDYSYTINVRDSEPPEIKFSNITSNVKKGEVVKMATATVTDNVSADCEVKVYLTLPSGEIVRISENKFVATSIGKYTVSFYCYDANNNIAIKSYTVISEG